VHVTRETPALEEDAREELRLPPPRRRTTRLRAHSAPESDRGPARRRSLQPRRPLETPAATLRVDAAAAPLCTQPAALHTAAGELAAPSPPYRAARCCRCCAAAHAARSAARSCRRAHHHGTVMIKLVDGLSANHIHPVDLNKLWARAASMRATVREMRVRWRAPSAAAAATASAVAPPQA